MKHHLQKNQINWPSYSPDIMHMSFFLLFKFFFLVEEVNDAHLH